MPQAKEDSCLVMGQQIRQTISGFSLLVNLLAPLRYARICLNGQFQLKKSILTTTPALLYYPGKPELKIEDLWVSLRSVLFKIDRSTQKLTTSRMP